MAVDSLIEYITLYRRRPLHAHLYVIPFAGLLCSWLYIWLNQLGYEEHYELGMIVLSAICILQALVFLFSHWFVSIRCCLMYYKEKNASNAEFAAVVPTLNNGWPEIVPLHNSRYENNYIVWFEFQRVIYRLDQETGQFSTVVFDSYRPIDYFKAAHGLETEEQLRMSLHRFGNNKTEMVIPQFWDLFMERATAPFFVFQVFCVGLWCLEDMWYYSLFTLFMLATFEATLVKAQMKNMQEIRNMGNKKFFVNVYRSKKWIKISSEELVVGDIVSLGRSTENQTVPCDVLLLRGNCIVDESMLTGESVPQMKEPIEDLEKDRYFDIDADSRLHVIFGGTTVVQHTSPTKGDGIKSTDGGCLCFVLRTGFNTSQGRLLRTILFGVKRVTANNIETLFFILFLLIFAVAASGYLWVVGSQDEKRSKYKLFLECTLIITSVIPPELPIELSLAVNSSLIALQKLGVFCTEPFRIPFAGKIDFCCFDKTGTLTTDNLVVEGVSMIQGGGENGIISNINDVPVEAIQVLSTCHSLVKFEENLVGDPLEKACLEWCKWTLTKADAVVPQKGVKIPGMRIFHRFHFSSSMRRMSVIAGYQTQGSQDSNILISVKGAPEVLRSMYKFLPEDYDDTYTKLTRQGSRVLALGIKEMPGLRQSEIREKTRDFFEEGLNFAGFVVISCPLKPDSKMMIKEILESSHRVVMITGDNPLTACHVAKVLKFTRSKKTTLILDSPVADGSWKWTDVNELESTDLVPSNLKEFFKSYEFCLTGAAFTYLQNEHADFLSELLPNVRIFARMAPKQKENAINEYKKLGLNTLMCGDGTNDVGALKHANVGVALLTNPYDATKAEQREKEKKEKIEEARRLHREANAPSLPPGVVRRPDFKTRMSSPPVSSPAQKRLQELMKELEEEEKASVVKLGDASIAAPFTSKYTSIASICHVIKQGRCTLVTTLQMFKILALNALVSAYSLSVLYLDGVKFSDTQATIQGLLLAACFLFISRSKPLQTLSKQRPLPNIFNFYTITTVTVQFIIHFALLLFMVSQAHQAEPIEGPIDLEAKFTPNVLNTTVYIMSMALQVCTFAVNYRGRPFMESLFENKALLYSILFSGFAVFILASGNSADLMTQFELVVLPNNIRNNLLCCLSLDLIGCYVADRILNYFLGDMY